MGRIKNNISFVVIALAFMGCSPSLESTLLGHSWTITEITSDQPVDMNQDGRKSTDVMSQNPACMSDDVLRFKPITS